jgi:hypothetical protein
MPKFTRTRDGATGAASRRKRLSPPAAVSPPHPKLKQTIFFCGKRETRNVSRYSA